MPERRGLDGKEESERQTTATHNERAGHTATRWRERMLNRSTVVNEEAEERRDVRGEATWRCRRGHLTKAWLRYDGQRALGGSAWDFCDECSDSPNPIADTRAHIAIFSGWLDQDEITPDEYRALCRAVLAKEYTPEMERNPVAMLGLPTWQQVQNGNIQFELDQNDPIGGEVRIRESIRNAAITNGNQGKIDRKTRRAAISGINQQHRRKANNRRATAAPRAPSPTSSRDSQVREDPSQQQGS